MGKKTSHSMVPLISLCPNCKDHPYQDKVYGRRVRLKNQLAIKASRNVEYRCSVCLKVDTR